MMVFFKNLYLQQRSYIDLHLGIVMGNPGVSRTQPIPQKPLPTTRTGLPIKISPKTSKLVEK